MATNIWYRSILLRILKVIQVGGYCIVDFFEGDFHKSAYSISSRGKFSWIVKLT